VASVKLLLIWIGDKSTRPDPHMDESTAAAAAYPGIGKASVVAAPHPGMGEASAAGAAYQAWRNSLMGRCCAVAAADGEERRRQAGSAANGDLARKICLLRALNFLRARAPYWILSLVDSPYSASLDRRELLGPRATLVLSRDDGEASSAPLRGPFCKINSIQTGCTDALYMPLLVWIEIYID
jgi:hypothetical protein